jgi:hypothetical protein
MPSSDLRIMISYPFTGEPKLNGKIDKEWMRSYLGAITNVLET